MEEDYDMVPHNEILKLKKEVEDLKSGTGSEIRKAMHELTDSINRMNEILKEAAEGMKTEESESLQLNKKIGLLIDKLDAITEENKKIAESMITLADLIKERFPVQRGSQVPRMLPRAPPEPTMPLRSVPPPMSTQNIPSPLPLPSSQRKGLPPTPLGFGEKKKKGLFSRMKWFLKILANK